MKPRSIDHALLDTNLLGAALGKPDSWSAWVAALKAAFGMPLDHNERDAFARIAGNRAPPSRQVSELWAVVGRRGGKSRIAAAIATYIAAFVDHRRRLAPGETGYVLVLAPTQSQATVVFTYVKAFFGESPILRQQIENITANEIKLAGNIAVTVHANRFRSVRGRTLIACIFDEVAFWRDETSASPDIETYRAILPALATTGGMLVGISSPYRRLGLLHQKHRDHYGKDDADVLVVQGKTTDFNPMLDAAVIERARASDPEAARAEWDAEFRSDLSALLDDAVVDNAIVHGRPLELAPQASISYIAFTDASAGRHDAFTVCIGHRVQDGQDRDTSRFVADVIRGRKPPFDPNEVAQEYAALAREYRVRTIFGDNYAEWVAGAFETAGLKYERSPLPKSQLYLEGLPFFNRGAVAIPDIPILARELRLLERRVHRSGRDSVDHGQGGSDDYANVVFGCLHGALSRSPGERYTYGIMHGVRRVTDRPDRFTIGQRLAGIVPT